MTDILSADGLAALAAAMPLAEEFGPHSDRPYLAIALDGADPLHADWLRGLPCPVIGLGAGPLGPACDTVLDDPADLAAIARNIRATPIAAMVLVQHLRAAEGLDATAHLTAESFAYATLQQGTEFKKFSFTRRQPAASNAPLIIIDRPDDATIHLTLNHPANRNAIDVVMRDALAEALDLALADPDRPAVHLAAAGRCFSTGGEVAEFGLAADPATAHWVRSLRLPAHRLARLADRLTVHVQGAAIGAGVEMAAFAHRLTCTPDAWFHLPELQYGLIPGAGGTVSLPRRIGRQRTAQMALSMRRVPAALALQWGLVDAIAE
ncbi:Enoyl-CoA hydratase/isomerase [Sphingomonas laterariae]|uniref:Enoyl-CoA hydratase/isomerase n=1 Tax=Edaphosphingomonas laterariae TaxID=861865 RepID=A0A239D4L9_9SPHN|nr:enoyl-CoA hydratase/isomerase family protein [Sphingomonas laterariae]SNS27456.1 Enoyl-CoA hydratase/isomerase [Sphingomonas laterariae]